MNAPGKSLLKVTSILFIAFGVTALLVALVTLARNLVVYKIEFADIFLYFSFLILLSLLEMLLGILGVKKYADPSKANFFIFAGVVLFALNIVPFVFSFNPFRLIGFVLPIPCIIGGILSKKAAASPAA